MKFEYNGKEYDLRLKAKYLPKELRNIGSFDLMLFLSNRTPTEYKQELLTSWLKGATVKE